MLWFAALIAILSISSAFRFTLPHQQPLSSLLEYPDEDAGPTERNARANANHIFSSLHSSLRQWGSSVKHNGMSFFPVSIPNGSLLYHGTHSPEKVTGLEWLALEIEHAEIFVGDSTLPKSPRSDMERDDDENEAVAVSSGDSLSLQTHGYLHTYQANRPLNRLLYVDGMSAAKTAMGTMDTQDLIIRNTSTKKHSGYDRIRGQELCEFTREWGVEGIMRMEGGFEIIFCNFTNGLDLLHVDERASPNTTEGENSMRIFEYVRGVSSRYHGLTGGRVEIDHSSMVSAFFYDVNLTNPDTNASELPRLVSSSSRDLLRIKSDLQSMLEERYSSPLSQFNRGIDWQGVVDMIVTRYSTRLLFMTQDSTTKFRLLAELNTLLNPFIDYGAKEINLISSIDRCQNLYLAHIRPHTRVDRLLFAAISTVTGKICTTLFNTRKLLLEEKMDFVDKQTSAGRHKACNYFQTAKKDMKDLIQWLDWSIWNECKKCEYNEVCFIAMWPIGTRDDHYSPSCTNDTDLWSRIGYWDLETM